MRAAALLLALLALLLPPRFALAADERPADAPRTDPAKAHLAPPPEEYHTEDDGWIRFSYHPSAGERVRPLASLAGAMRAELVAELGPGILSSVEVRVAAVQAEMVNLGPTEPDEPPPSSYATAVAYSDLHLVVMSLLSPIVGEPADLEEGLRHQLAHLALDDALHGGSVPRWFHEGYAVHFSGENGALRAETLCLAALRERTLWLRDLESHLPVEAAETSVAYAESADFVRFLLQKSPKAHLADVLAEAGRGEPFERAIPAAFHADLSQVELAWRGDMARRYGFVPVLAGATLFSVLVATGISLSRFRRRRAPAARRGHRSGRRVRPSMSLARSAALAVEEMEAEEQDLFLHPPPSPGVPRVEHRGRWYTLH